MPVFPGGRFGREAPPELCEGQRCETVLESILQELGRRTFTRARRWLLVAGGFEKREQRFAAACFVDEMVVFKDALLQVDGVAFARRFQPVYFRRVCGLPAQRLDGCVDSGKLLHAGIYKAAVCQRIKDRRHKTGVVVGAGQFAGEGRQVSRCAIRLANSQHAKHFPHHTAAGGGREAEVVLPFLLVPQVVLQLRGGQEAERVRVSRQGKHQAPGQGSGGSFVFERDAVHVGLQACVTGTACVYGVFEECPQRYGIAANCGRSGAPDI